MRAVSLLLATACVATALEPSVTHGPKVQAAAALVPRQTGDLGGEGMVMQTINEKCVSDALDFFESMPTLSPELHQAIDGPNEDDCISLPQSLDSEFQSYSSAIEDWYSEYSDVFRAVGSNCPTPTGDAAVSEQSFCEGEGPEDRDDAAGTIGMSMAAAVGCFLVSAALLI